MPLSALGAPRRPAAAVATDCNDEIYLAGPSPARAPHGQRRDKVRGATRPRLTTTRLHRFSCGEFVLIGELVTRLAGSSDAARCSRRAGGAKMSAVLQRDSAWETARRRPVA
jgi:hypothetical protein